MDTVSHLTMGATLAGLAYIDPAVAGNASLAQAVLIGSLLGSHAPDLDTVLRMRGAASYIQYHRGITHSLPALLIWPMLITLPLCSVFHLYASWPTLYLWTLLAVVLHVLLDTLNSYGVQSLRPFSRQWVHLDILSIFEPFLFVLHACGLVIWRLYHFEPVPLFGTIYSVSLGYILLRALQHRYIVRLVTQALHTHGTVHVLPTLSLFTWRYVVEAEYGFYTGRIRWNHVIAEAEHPKEERNTVVLATMGVDGVRAFLGFAQRIHVTCKEVADGYEVRWSDVRFSHGQRLSFGVDVQLDRELRVIAHRIGWRKRVWDPPFV